jgi:hypothetical protein
MKKLFIATIALMFSFQIYAEDTKDSAQSLETNPGEYQEFMALPQSERNYIVCNKVTGMYDFDSIYLNFTSIESKNKYTFKERQKKTSA